MKLTRGIVFSLVLITACSGSGEPDSTVPGVKRSESELKQYVAWQHDYRVLANRQHVERVAETERLRTTPPTPGVAPEAVLSNFISAQDHEIGRFMETAPRSPTATALRATLAGIGVMKGDAQGMTYTPMHDDAQLDRARANYGPGFVSWVLKHEAKINSAIGG